MCDEFTIIINIIIVIMEPGIEKKTIWRSVLLMPFIYFSQVRQFFATKSNNVRLIKSIYKPEFVSILLPNLTN